MVRFAAQPVYLRTLTPSPLQRADKDATGTIDVAAFNQILDLDDDDTHYACSKDMFAMYFAQAPAAFKGMDTALAATDLRGVADLAHFLMGSSATLGIVRVAGSCARMEGAGEAGLQAREPRRGGRGAETAALAQIGALLVTVKREYADAEIWLRAWYAEQGETFDEVVPPAEGADGPGDSGPAGITELEAAPMEGLPSISISEATPPLDAHAAPDSAPVIDISANPKG
ncbi:signal transduction histidine kinase [Mycena vulgaris]|nr:signal transduction histidine kinase [Mycena vulgaris]